MKFWSGTELKQDEIYPYGWKLLCVCKSDEVGNITICLRVMQIFHWLKTSLMWALAVQLLTKCS